MNKILTVLVLCILISGLFRVAAISNNNQIENKSLNMRQYELEIIIEGGFLGYTISVMNIGTTRASGNLSVEILMNAMVVLFGANLTGEFQIDLDPLSSIEKFNLRTLIGFGSASISISGVFVNEENKYPFETNTNGYAFLIFVVCDETTILIP